MKIDKQFKDFFKKRAPIKAIYGGRMSGKSYSVAGFLIYMAANYKVRILCTRRFQAKITESVYSLLKKLCKDLQMSKTAVILKGIRELSAKE